MILKEGYPFIAIATGLAVLGWVVSGVWLGLPLAFVAVWVVAFFRNPRRVIPEAAGIVIAPADGTIVKMGETTSPLLQTPSRLVSIFMSAFNVHVNRAPVGGVVRSVRYIKGRYHAAFKPTASEVNERNEIVIEDAQGRPLTLVQVAGVMARRIVCYLKEGMRVAPGERIGLIRFGSRVDLYLPLEATVCVRTGESVKGGETILARF